MEHTPTADTMTATSGFESVKKAFPGGVLLPGDDGYEDVIQRWSAVCVKRAGAVVLPRTTEEVGRAVKLLSSLSIPFNVSGGRHATSGTASMGPEGAVIDLRRMRGVSVDAAAHTVTFEGGCLWSDVDDAAWEHGLATPGGTVADTGVGGLVLGGGFGWLSGRHGLTIDCLVSVEMVLADGSVVVASDDEGGDKDLFWAVRGAGASFGVATRFTSCVFPQGNVWSGALVFPFERAAEVVGAVNEHLEVEEGDQAVMLAPGYGPPGPDGARAKAVAMYVFHNGTAAEGARYFAALLALGPVLNATAEMPYRLVNRQLDHLVTPGARWQHGVAHMTGPVDAAAFVAAASKFYAYVDCELASSGGAQDLRNTVLGFEIFPWAKACSVPATATAHSNRGRYYNVGLVMNWTDASRDAEVRRFKKELADLISETMYHPKASRESGSNIAKSSQYLYGNYLDQPISAEGAFGDNAVRLRELKARYDPENRFDKLWRLADRK
ncbi:hypothetical protein RB597_005286 [Gaeumannomyces tritici]